MQLPKPLIDSLQNVTGFDEEAFIEVHQSAKQVTSVRLNPSKPLAGNHFSNAEIVPWCPTGRYLPERPSFTLDPVFHGGAYYVQEASSMFLDHVVRHLYKDEVSPARVLDACAAPGGKSTLLAAAFPHSLIVSNEVIKTRVSVLSENITKWGSENVLVTNNDPKDFSGLPGFFDCMVVDAPCSGSGLFRKDHDAIEEWSEANVEMCSLRQQRILSDIIPSLKQNGFLVYSTCSYSQQENEEICDWIVDSFQLEPLNIPVEAEWGIVEAFSEKHKAPGYRFYPDKVRGEGFFIACFRQYKPVDQFYGYPAKLPLVSKNEKALLEKWIKDIETYTIFNHKDNIIAFTAKWQDDLSAIQKVLNIKKTGVAIGQFKGKDLVPHHELALSGLTHEAIPVIYFTKEDALKYLRRQDLKVENEKNGWTMAAHEGIKLGWMKILPNRVNNYYPTNWRILKH